MAKDKQKKLDAYDKATKALEDAVTLLGDTYEPTLQAEVAPLLAKIQTGRRIAEQELREGKKVS